MTVLADEGSEEFELTVKLDAPVEFVVATLGVIVIEELRDVIDEGLRCPGRKVPPSDEDEASFWSTAPALPLSRRICINNGPHRLARRYELTGMRSPPIARRSMSAKSRIFIAISPRSIAAQVIGRPPKLGDLVMFDDGRTGALIEG